MSLPNIRIGVHSFLFSPHLQNRLLLKKDHECFFGGKFFCGSFWLTTFSKTFRKTYFCLRLYISKSSLNAVWSSKTPTSVFFLIIFLHSKLVITFKNNEVFITFLMFIDAVECLFAVWIYFSPELGFYWFGKYRNTENKIKMPRTLTFIGIVCF